MRVVLKKWSGRQDQTAPLPDAKERRIFLHTLMSISTLLEIPV